MGEPASQQDVSGNLETEVEPADMRSSLASPTGPRIPMQARAIQHLAQAGDWPAVQLVRELCVSSEGFQASITSSRWTVRPSRARGR
jgi:hypothetical protein